MNAIRDLARKLLPGAVKSRISNHLTKPKLLRAEPGSQLEGVSRFRLGGGSQNSLIEKIEERALATERQGAMPLWEGYEKLENYPGSVGPGAKRSSEQVRTNQQVGRFFLWLVETGKPDCVVEFGTAFGVSGMYWLAGLEANGRGTLYTFDPNEIWAAVARENLKSVSNRFISTIGAFEDHVGVLDEAGETIDLCLIDAIHTSDFVNSQLAIVMKRVKKGSLVVLDDINFSDDMNACWKEVARDPRFSAAVEFAGVGVVEVA